MDIHEMPFKSPEIVQNDKTGLPEVETQSLLEPEPVAEPNSTSQPEDIQKSDVEEVTETSRPSNDTPEPTRPNHEPEESQTTEVDKNPPPSQVTFPRTDSAVSFLITKEDEGNSNAIVESCVAEPILTLEKLVELCNDNPNVLSAHFALGLPPSNERFNFHEVIYLSNLTKLSIELPRITKMSQKQPAIPQDFKRLIYFLKQLQFVNLQTIDIICSTEQAACIPLASAFVPCYELSDYSPLADLVCRNRKTLKSLTLGKWPNHQVQITLNPKECDAICEPKYYPKIENFLGIPNFPVLTSWSVMLRPQRHLKKLSMAFVDQEVWDFVCEGIENSSDTVTSVNFSAFGMKSLPLDLIYFKRCICLTSFTLRYYGFSVLGWEYLPGGIKHLHLGGKVSVEDVEKMITALPLLEDICIELKKNYFRVMDEIVVDSKIDITQLPTFEFAKRAEKSIRNIREIRFESDPENQIHFVPVSDWINQQSYFTLKTVSSHELILCKVLKEKDELDFICDSEDMGAVNEFFGSCFGGMFVYV